MAEGQHHKKESYEHLIAAIKSGELHLPEGYRTPEHHGHPDSFTTVREATYRGKAIRVETTYRITIDNETIKMHTMALADGTVHCHAFPNYSFASALDLARKIVDFADEELPKNELGEVDTGHKGGGE